MLSSSRARRVHAGKALVMLVVLVGACVLSTTATESYSDREISAKFKHGISGKVTLRQAGRDAPTEVHVTLKGLKGVASGYSINTIPLLDSDSAHGDGCIGVSAKYDPNDMGSCTQGASGTSCAIGDLSGRHGSLDGSKSIDVTYTDDNLPLYGWAALFGRPVVVYDANETPIACANLGYPGPTTQQFVDFNATKNLRGQVVFRQVRWDDTSVSEATILLMLKYADHSSKATTGHGWHIHEKRVPVYDPDNTKPVSVICGETGGHYNPQNVCTDVSCSYQALCGSKENQTYCEVGDLSGKHGKAKIPAKDQEMYMGFYVDTTVRLSDIQNLSVVVHDKDSGAARIGCANIVTTKSTKPSSTVLTDGEIAGMVIGLVMLVALAAFVVYYVIHNKNTHEAGPTVGFSSLSNDLLVGDDDGHPLADSSTSDQQSAGSEAEADDSIA